MYVCICNALKEAEARRVAPGCGEAREIYGQLGCAPRCGRCIPTMQEILEESRPAASVISGPAVDLRLLPAE